MSWQPDAHRAQTLDAVEKSLRRMRLVASVATLLNSGLCAQMRGPEPVESVLAAFSSASLVALGERHWAQEDSQFRLALLNSPVFPLRVNDIVVEFANPVHQIAERRHYATTASALILEDVKDKGA